MTPRRLILLLILCLLAYLGLYTWNQRTSALDRLAAHTGLEAIGAVLRPVAWVHETVDRNWDNYVSLVNARDELFETQAKLELVTIELARRNEDAAELVRLRALLTLGVPPEWETVGARVLASRLGLNGMHETMTIDHGYLSGGGAGVPVATHEGIVGRILRSGPLTATVLLAIDPDSRIAVISQDSRTQGILVGGGVGAPMDLKYVPINNALRTGEVLVTSGLDGVYPKGIPVARVVQNSMSSSTMFQCVTATPTTDINALEEVLLLQAPTQQYLPLRYEEPLAAQNSAAIATDEQAPKP
ncbi:MAG: rod shape-determining protein MreC [Pseudomonadota bacterium]